MIITLTGPNTFAIAQAQRQLIEAFTKKHGANGVEQVDGEILELQRLPDLLQGSSLFAAARLVILKNISANKSVQEPLAEALSRAANDTTVVIADNALDKRTKLYKFLKSASTFKEFLPLSDAQLVAWAQDIAKKDGAVLAAAEAQYLITRAGRDQWRLLHELQKLAAHQTAISRDLINQLVEQAPEGTAFELLDAALAGDQQKLAHLVRQLSTEEDPYKLFGLLASQVHALAVVANAGGRSADIIAKEAGLHPFVVRKTQALAQRLTLAQVASMAEAVALCDFQLKSTGADPWQLIGTALQKVAR